MLAESTAPPQIEERRRLSLLFPFVIVAATAGAAAVLYLFDPADHGFYPICYFNLLTGLNCPGCGALRAMHQLLHGHVAEAARLNLLLLISLGPVAWQGGRLAMARWRGREWSIPPSWLWSFLALTSVFTVLRNLPQFNWLAP